MPLQDFRLCLPDPHYGRVRDNGLPSAAGKTRLSARTPSLSPRGRAASAGLTVPSNFKRVLRGVSSAKAAEKKFVKDGYVRPMAGSSFEQPGKGFVLAGGCNAHASPARAASANYWSNLLRAKRGLCQSLSPDRFTETSWTWPEAIGGRRDMKPIMAYD